MKKYHYNYKCKGARETVETPRKKDYDKKRIF